MNTEFVQTNFNKIVREMVKNMNATSFDCPSTTITLLLKKKKFVDIWGFNAVFYKILIYEDFGRDRENIYFILLFGRLFGNILYLSRIIKESYVS